MRNLSLLSFKNKLSQAKMEGLLAYYAPESESDFQEATERLENLFDDDVPGKFNVKTLAHGAYLNAFIYGMANIVCDILNNIHFEGESAENDAVRNKIQTDATYVLNTLFHINPKMDFSQNEWVAFMQNWKCDRGNYRMEMLGYDKIDKIDAFEPDRKLYSNEILLKNLELDEIQKRMQKLEEMEKSTSWETMDDSLRREIIQKAIDRSQLMWKKHRNDTDLAKKLNSYTGYNKKLKELGNLSETQYNAFRQGIKVNLRSEFDHWE